MKLLVATRNAGKLREISRLLANSRFDVIGLTDLAGLPEVVEDGATFAANAEKKARQIASLTGELTLADDSGLAVAALNGAPGVYSARYAGEQGDDAANNAKLLAEMRQVPAGKRQAAFICAMALCHAQSPLRLFHGRLEGEILLVPRGRGGFGYDPLFFLPGQGCSLAELPLEAKTGSAIEARPCGRPWIFCRAKETRLE